MTSEFETGRRDNRRCCVGAQDDEQCWPRHVAGWESSSIWTIWNSPCFSYPISIWELRGRYIAWVWLHRPNVPICVNSIPWRGTRARSRSIGISASDKPLEMNRSGCRFQLAHYWIWLHSLIWSRLRECRFILYCIWIRLNFIARSITLGAREGGWGGIAIEGNANSQNLKEIMLTCAFCRINGGVQTEQELSNYSSVKNRILLIWLIVNLRVGTVDRRLKFISTAN